MFANKSKSLHRLHSAVPLFAWILPLVISILLVPNTYAQSDEVYLGIEFGAGELKASKDYTPDTKDDSSPIVGGALVLGYHWASNWVVESRLANRDWDSGRLFGLGTNYDLDELTIMAGYSWPIAKYFRVVPMLGLSSWKLDVESGIVNSAIRGATTSKEFSGTDLTAKINAEIPLGNLVVLYLSYTVGAYDFGNSDMGLLGLKFEF